MFSRVSSFNNIEGLLISCVPLGFSQNKSMAHHVAHILQKFSTTERFDFLSYDKNNGLLKIMVSLQVYWVSDKTMHDNYQVNSMGDIQSQLCKSVSFASRIKQSSIVHNLMQLAKDEKVSSQTKSKFIKTIAYQSKGNFENNYNPRPMSPEMIQPMNKMYPPVNHINLRSITLKETSH